MSRTRRGGNHARGPDGGTEPGELVDADVLRSVDYNELRRVAKERGVVTGRHPTKEDLVEALAR